VTDIKYVKACPFLRDLGDSYLCVNDDKVIDIIIDPLVNIEWTDKLPPVTSEVEDGTKTCLFNLEIMDDGRLFCSSRGMYLRMDRRDIYWKDIRDSVFLLELDKQPEFHNMEVEFCSTCLYKVLIASSPAFQSRLDFNEKIKLGSSYILNKANEIYTALLLLSESQSKHTTQAEGISSDLDRSKATIFNKQVSALSWLTWITDNEEIDEVFASTTFEWLQKLDEWGLIISRIAEVDANDEKIKLIREAFEYAARLKEISFEIIMKLSYLRKQETDPLEPIINIEKIISVAGVQFEDFMFICSQFFSIIKDKT